GSGLEKSLLVTDSAAFAEEVKAEVIRQTAIRNRREIIERMIQNNGMLFAVVPDLATDGVTLCNRFAAEHLELQAANADTLLPLINCAGAVFVGYWTPESAGDFVAGPSHVLPTGGAARMFSGLTAETFRRRSSFVSFTKEDLAETRAAIETFGALEGLDAHAYAATVRFED
ncbi:MAG: histidinol dehydrogenase, partial [Kiritimatiellae bacterium]|nr:histidinol dehydrogenase [Kiritimatiellia bacterium]